MLALLALAWPAMAAIPAANPQRYLADVKYLASPAREGRGAGTKGLREASQYIEHEFQSLGLKPAGTRSYLQPFLVTTGARLKGRNQLLVRLNGSSRTLKLGEDYTPLSFSATGSVSAPLVFAGYGVTAPEFQYDDYAGVDVKDKVAVILRYEPKRFQEKSGHPGLTRHAQLITKAINARNHGARAVILLNGALPAGEQDLLLKFGSQAGPQNVGIPMVQVKNAVAAEWLQAADKSLSELQHSIDSDLKPGSFALPDSAQVSLAVGIEQVHATVANVLGYLPGKSDEYIIIGAHYDHLGRGGPDSLAPSQIGQIHPGADDNASGTAGVMELARMFTAEKTQPERGILFVTFAGEELGLLGSAHWVNNPTLPLDKAVAMINMDMIGRIRDSKLYVGGIGTGSTFNPGFENIARKYRFNIAYSAGGYSASDHTSFVAKKIPVLFFFSGLHSDYHKPSDTWDKIDAPDAARLLDMVAEEATSLDYAQNRPQFVVVASDAREENAAAGRGEGRGYGPWFGSIPDFGQSEDGVKFSDVQPGSPAAKAGFRAGDVLVQFGDSPIHNLYDFTDALRRSKVGDVVPVKVLRDGKPVTASVTLEQRR